MAQIPIKNVMPGASSPISLNRAPLASDFPGVLTGTLVQDTLNGDLYINVGSPTTRNWEKVTT